MTARIVHLMGWTVVRVDDPADLDGLAEHLQPQAGVAVELATDLGADHDAALVGLQQAAGEAGAQVVVVAPEGLRARLRDAGLSEVHESLDAAVGDQAPPRRVDEQVSHVTPAAGDTVIVTAEDMLGGDGR